LIFFLNGTIDFAISFRTLWTIFWLAKTSNKPISLTTWLAVNPLTCNLLISATDQQVVASLYRFLSEAKSNFLTPVSNQAYYMMFPPN